MPAKRPWYPHYPADYARRTAQLTMLEDGAYRRLLDHYYLTGEPLPGDPKQLHRICKATCRSEHDAVNAVLSTFFVIREDGLYHQTRADEEIAKAAELSQKRAGAASNRWSKPDAIADGLHNQKHTQSQSHTQKKEKEEQPERSQARASPAKGCRWPVDAVVPDDWIAEAAQKRQEHHLPAIDLRLEAERFATWWPAQPGSKGIKLDWRATWRTWALKERSNGQGNGTRQPGRTGADQTRKFLTDIFEAAEDASTTLRGQGHAEEDR